MQTLSAAPIVLQRTAAIVVMAVMSVTGMTGLVSADSISNTGANSRSRISHSMEENCSIRNTNNIRLNNSNRQSADTGDVQSRANTTSGLAVSGDAINENDTSTAARVDNSGAGNICECPETGNGFGMMTRDAAINNTGANSTNTIEEEVTVDTTITNTNNVNISNTNNQTATTGDVVSTQNTTAGSAFSGDAVNSNATDVLALIQNGSATVGGNGSCGGSSVTPVGGIGGGTGGGSNVGPSSHAFAARNNDLPSRTFGNSMGNSSGNGRHTNSNSPTRSYSAATTQRPAAVTGTNNGVGSSTPAPAPTASQPVSPAPVRPATAPTATISNTGANSNNTISNDYNSDTSVTNTNNVTVSNTSTQNASSGDVTSTQNTTAGGAESGFAGNGNDTGTAVAVKN